MKNQLINSLAVYASTFIPPLPPKLTYEVQVKYRPSPPDNVKYWRVFEDDEKLTGFYKSLRNLLKRTSTKKMKPWKNVASPS